MFDIVLNTATATSPDVVECQTAECLQALGAQLDMGAPVINRQQNREWARGCNLAAREGKAPWILFMDIRRKPGEGFAAAVNSALESHAEAAAFSFRLLPEETGYHCNPVTLEAYTLPPEAMLVNREAFEALNGFDSRLPPCAAARDLAVRLRAAGHTLYYLPGAVVLQTEAAAGATDGRQNYLDDTLGNLLLAYKYGHPAKARKAYRAQLATPRHFESVRKLLLRQYLEHFISLWPGRLWRWRHAALARKAEQLAGSAYILPLGPNMATEPFIQGPKISVVIRTHKRPQSLRATLQSLAHQTYKNLEIVVVEDGAPTAQDMIRREFGHLPLVYTSTGTPIGRSRAGNLGMQKASGEYLNLLDDDDYFYPDHLELFAAQATANPDADILLGFSTAMLAEETGQSPYTLAVKALRPIRYDRLDVFTMCQSCQIHIAGAIFKKSLFTQCGGLDESLDAHEDWAMWLRYLAVARRAGAKGADVPRSTTVFVQPADPEVARQRMRQYMQSDAAFFGDESIRFTLTLQDLRGFYDGVLADIRHVKSLGELDEYLDQQANRDRYRE